MASQTLTFTDGSYHQRVTLDEEGNPWFIAADACMRLELGNTSQAIARLDEDEKGVISIDTLGGAQTLATISEAGLYTLVLGSRKPEAKSFKRWVTHEVLPSIRKMGSYMAPAAADVPKTFAQALRLAADQAEKIEAQQRQLAAQQPAVEFVASFVDAKATKGIREVAKVLGLKERGFVAQLAADGVLFRQSGKLLPSAEYQHRGYFEVKTGEAPNGHVYTQPRFTPAGIAWAAERYAMPTKAVPPIPRRPVQGRAKYRVLPTTDRKEGA